MTDEDNWKTRMQTSLRSSPRSLPVQQQEEEGQVWPGGRKGAHLRRRRRRRKKVALLMVPDGSSFSRGGVGYEYDSEYMMILRELLACLTCCLQRLWMIDLCLEFHLFCCKKHRKREEKQLSLLYGKRI